MLELHSSQEQVCMTANSMTVQHFATHRTLEQCLQDLSSATEEADPGVPVPLENFLPSGRHRRCKYMEYVETGMNMPTALVTYMYMHSLGVNIDTFTEFGVQVLFLRA